MNKLFQIEVVCYGWGQPIAGRLYTVSSKEEADNIEALYKKYNMPNSDTTVVSREICPEKYNLNELEARIKLQGY